jgi:small subunit ribosomal protein S6
MTRIYEEMFIVRPDATEEVIDPIIDQLTKFINGHGGKVEKTDKWGKRRLAYRVEKCDEGFYVLMTFSATPDTVFEVERRLRVNDAVIKFLTTRIDERMKVAEKRKKKAEKRAARKPPPPPMTPAIPAAVPGAAVPAAPMPGAPGAPTAPAPAAPAAPAPAAPAAPAAETPDPAAPPTTPATPPAE